MRLAIVGATGQIGQTFIQLLEEVSQDAQPQQVRLVASQRSQGNTLRVCGKEVEIESLEVFDFSEVDCAFFALNHALTKHYVPIARAHCRLVIDNSSAYRLDPTVPLIVPEVNFSHWYDLGCPNLISNPNCSTAQMIIALHSIQTSFGIKRVDVATYQSISGAGNQAIQDFKKKLTQFSNSENQTSSALDVYPSIDSNMESGMTKEEMKMHWESQKIWRDDKITIQATCVRVPVLIGHAEACHVETHREIDWQILADNLDAQPGLTWHKDQIVTPYKHAQGNNQVHVCRVRRDLTDPNRLCMWVVADNMRKGGAWNAIQIYMYWLNAEQRVSV